MKDPESFIVPCSISSGDFGCALCDLGASINLMPLYIFKKLSIGEAQPTKMALQLAEISIAHPEEKIKDVLVVMPRPIRDLELAK